MGSASGPFVAPVSRYRQMVVAVTDWSGSAIVGRRVTGLAALSRRFVGLPSSRVKLPVHA